MPAQLEVVVEDITIDVLIDISVDMVVDMSVDEREAVIRVVVVLIATLTIGCY